jgi:acetyl esterase/lipase
MASWLLLIVSIVGAGFTLSSLVRIRHLWYFTFPYFMAAWLTGELALHHIAWQAAATVVFVSFGALEAWPGMLGLGITLLSWLGLVFAHRQALRANETVQAALDEMLATGALREGAPPKPRVNPFRMRLPGTERISNLAYGEALPGDKGRRNLLDVLRPAGGGERLPTLLQIHGGGWIIGEKEQQGLPLMNHLAARGWVCVALNYRLSPKATFPDHIVDVKRALAWIRAHGPEYGADPNFVCVTGGSAGGHLAALAALSENDPAFQPGFEDADTSIAACVPFYGIYDLLDRSGVRGRSSMTPFIEKTVLKCPPESNRELWENASPISRVHADAPPFFVIHGGHDSLAFVEDARLFVEALRKKSRNSVAYAEFPGAQHAFDTFHSARSAHAVHAVTAFLEDVYAAHRARTTQAAER